MGYPGSGRITSSPGSTRQSRRKWRMFLLPGTSTIWSACVSTPVRRETYRAADSRTAGMPLAAV